MLAGERVLLFEDSLTIALDAEDVLDRGRNSRLR